MSARKGQVYKYTDDQLRAAAASRVREGSVTAAAREHGVHRTTMQYMLRQAADRGLAAPRTEANPSRWRPGEEIVAARKAEFARVKGSGPTAQGNVIHRPDDGPFMVVPLGDLHLDSPGTDLNLFEKWIAPLDRRKHRTGILMGDVLDNWVKPLAHLYSTSEIPAPEGWILLQYYLETIGEDLDISVGGNHDCHDMETEALTRRGWVLGADVRDDDHVLSLDGAGRAVWTTITERIVRDNDEEMVTIDGHVVSLNVTPNHRILHRKRNWERRWSDLQYCRADSLPTRFALPVSAPSGLAEHPLPDSWIALTGWFLTDGGMNYTRGCPRVTFYQSKPAPALEAALADSGFTPTIRIRDRAITEVCGRALKAPPLLQREYVLGAEQARRFLAVAQAKGVVCRAKLG